MFQRRLVVAVAFFAAVLSPVLLECTKTTAKQTGYVEDQCPVKLTSAPSQEPGGIYTEHITITVRMNSDDFCNSPRIEIHSPIKKIIKPTMKKRRNNPYIKLHCNNHSRQSETRDRCRRRVTQQSPHSNTSFVQCELVYDCVLAKAETLVSVSYNTTSTSCSVSYTVPDPIPDFNLSVNLASKSITVMVEPGDKVYTRWCYKKSPMHCMGSELSRQITIDPSQSQSALLNISYLLPCVCVQVYYTHADSCRHKKCPFENQSIADVTDVWLSSKVTLFESSLNWKSECPASDLKISASLCWKQHEHLCIPVLNSTLEDKESGQHLIYSTSELDKHPQMCVQFSLQGSHNISCPFLADMSSWEVYIEPVRQSAVLFLTSRFRAKFSAQLCLLNERGCVPIGEVYSVTTEGNTAGTQMNVPLHFLAEKPCVQVWQSDPSLHGRRILCLDYTHHRCGLYAVVALMFVVIAALLGIFIHRLTKSGAAGWLCIQNPVLLVCSSEQSSHISAVCSLASILQGELGATVHMALWALSSQTQTGASTGVADLGPLPWLYGQWEAVRKAQGKVLIVWSPEAMKTYEKWREERANMNKNERHENIPVEMDDFKLNGRRLGKCKKEKAAGKKNPGKICDDKDWYPQREPSSVIAPVFMAALACLEGALQGRKCQEVALVYFQGLCQSRDIPKDFRGVPRYCLPQEFRGLIQELGGMTSQTKTKFSWHCWPRLLSKGLSIWLARQLSERLQTLLPQTQGNKMQRPSVTSSLKMMSDKTQRRLKLLPAANTARPGTAQEHEPLHLSPWKP